MQEPGIYPESTSPSAACRTAPKCQKAAGEEEKSVTSAPSMLTQRFRPAILIDSVLKGFYVSPSFQP